nr:MAG TPA: hypothetical protein [Bacteriophage sp.]
MDFRLTALRPLYKRSGSSFVAHRRTIFQLKTPFRVIKTYLDLL